MKIRTTFLVGAFFMSLGFSCTVSAQAFVFDWGNQLEASANASRVEGIAADAAGNVYICGYITGTTDFDPGPGVFNLSAATTGDADMFVAKYTPAGALVWANRYGSSGDDFAHDLDVDQQGKVWVVGEFQGTVDFDPGSIFGSWTASPRDGIILVLSNNGVHQWSYGVGDTGEDVVCESIEYSAASDRMYIAGSMLGNADLDPGGNSTSTFLPDYGGVDAFWAQYNGSTGQFLQAGKIGSSLNDDGLAIAEDNSGNIYVGGNARGGFINVSSNSGPPITFLAGQNDSGFLVKYNSSGSPQWAQSVFTNTGNSPVYDIACGPNGEVAFSGEFFQTISYNTSSTSNVTFTGAGSGDLFVFKVNPADGYATYTGTVGEFANETGYGVEYDALGNLYVLTRFRGNTDLDPGPGVRLSNDFTFNYRSTILKIQPNDSLDWTYTTQGTSLAFPQAICLDQDDNLLYGGYFSNSVGFDLDPGPGTTLINNTTGYSSAWFSRGTYCEVQKITNSPTICQGDSLFVGGAYQTTSGTYVDSLINAGGCDSIITSVLTVAPNYNTTQNQSLCPGETLNFYGQIITAGGTYTHTVPSSQGCDSTETLVVDMPNIPGTINQNGTSLSATVFGATYQWFDCGNNTPIPGAMGIGFTPSGPGSYALIVTKDGCTDTTACYPYNLNSIPARQTIEVAAYPNPGHDQVLVTWAQSRGAVHVSVWDPYGRKVSAHLVEDAHQFQLEVTDWAAGVYLLRIESEDRAGTLKLLVQ